MGGEGRAPSPPQLQLPIDWDLVEFMGVEIVSDETFEQVVLDAQLPVLVDFFAEWCGPCKAMAPALDQIAAELSDAVTVVKLDVDKSRKIAQAYRIRAMPTLVLFKDGKPAKRHQGALVQKAKLSEWIDMALSSAPDLEVPLVPPRISGWKLANGMDVVVIERKGITEITHSLFHRVGAADAPAEAPHLTHIVTRLIAKEAARAGDQLRVFPGQDVTVLSQQTVVSLLSEVMQRAAERMRGMVFTDRELAEEGLRLADEVRSRPATDPRIMALKAMDSALFAGHPYSVSFDMVRADANVTSADADRLFRSRFATHGTALVISGDIAPDLVNQMVEATYGTVPLQDDLVPRQRPDRIAADASRLKLASGSANASLQRRYVVPSYVTAKSGEAEALDVLAKFMAQPEGSVHAALAAEAKSQNGMQAGYISSNCDYGQLFISISACDGDMERTEALVDQLIANIRLRAPEVSQIELAKETLLANHANYDEEKLHYRYGHALASGRTLAQLEGWREAVANVTAEDVRRVAHAHLIPRNELTAWLVSGDGA
jgi:zinc protease